MKNRYKIGLSTLLLMASGQVWAVASDDIPAYQKEYELYLQDLGIIEQTGKAPKNPELDTDLAKMDSNERIRLTASNFSSSVSLSFSQLQVTRNDAEVLSKVEVIRVPEEFQDMYADIYQQQLEQFEGSLSSEEQEALRRLRGAEDLVVEEHQNPFKDSSAGKVKEVAGLKSPEDSMVNAYFSSNRAFVSGDPIIVPSSEYSAGNSQSISRVTVRNNPLQQQNSTYTPSSSTSRLQGGTGTKRSSSSNRSGSGMPSLRRGMFVD